MKKQNTSEKKFLGGKNSNAYIIFYSTVMVVLVAAALAFASLYLKPYQEANVLNEKKDAILAAIGVLDGNYDETIKGYAVDASGNTVEGVTGEEALNMLFDLRGAMANGVYPVFESSNGEYVVPVIGKGLWGDIWGYVALKSDLNTIVGVVFSHAGETPGLGAEIEKPQFQEQFQGKHFFIDGNFTSIAVEKAGQKPQNGADYVDAVSGGTITSKGVQTMLQKCVKPYAKFLESLNSKNI